MAIGQGEWTIVSAVCAKKEVSTFRGSADE